MFQFPILITIITLFIYQILSLNVSKSRFQNKIPVPITTGNVNFERAYRTHLNFLENMVIFLPLVWICSLFFDNIFYKIVCVLWVCGRLVFSYAYIQNLNLKIKIVANSIAISAIFILLIMSISGLLK